MAESVDIDLYENIEEGFDQDGDFGQDADLYDDVIITASTNNDRISDTPAKREPERREEPRKSNVPSSIPSGYTGRRFSVYVGNLTWWTTDQDLTDALNSIGVHDLLEIKFYENRANGQSKGFAIVIVASETSSRAIFDKLPRRDMHGQTPLVTHCNKQSLNNFEAQARKGEPPPQQNDRGRDRGDQRGEPPRGGVPPQLPPPNQPPAQPPRNVRPQGPPFQPQPQGPPPGMQGPPPIRGPPPVTSGPPPNFFPGGGPPRPGMPPTSMPGGPPVSLASHPGAGPPPRLIAGPPPGIQVIAPGHPGHPHLRPGFDPRHPAPAPYPVRGPPPPQPVPPPGLRGPAPAGMHQARMPGMYNPGPRGPAPPGMPKPRMPGMPPSQPPPGVPPPGHPPGSVPGPAPHVNPAFFPATHGLPPPVTAVAPVGDPYGRPPPVSYPSADPYRPPQERYEPKPRQEPPPPVLSEQEFEEIFQRNKTVSSSAISRAVQDASAGDFASAIETLVTAVSLIKQSKIANDDRCKILISSLQDTLHGIEEKSYGSKTASRERRSRSRDRDRDRDREKRSRHRSRSRDREYRERSRERDSRREYEERHRESRGGASESSRRSESDRDRDRERDYRSSRH